MVQVNNVVYTLVWGTKKNEQSLFFFGHDSHFDPDTIYIMFPKHVHIFILKAGDPENNQQNNSSENPCSSHCTTGRNQREKYIDNRKKDNTTYE